jgi:hypothetical protein
VSDGPSSVNAAGIFEPFDVDQVPFVEQAETMTPSPP